MNEPTTNKHDTLQYLLVEVKSRPIKTGAYSGSSNNLSSGDIPHLCGSVDGHQKVLSETAGD